MLSTQLCARKTAITTAVFLEMFGRSEMNHNSWIPTANKSVSFRNPTIWVSKISCNFVSKVFCRIFNTRVHNSCVLDLHCLLE